MKLRSLSATEGYVPMRISFLLPLVFLGLAGCVTHVRESSPPASATVVTPAPQATYTAPSSTTVVRTP
jgi:hypothetical protein